MASPPRPRARAARCGSRSRWPGAGHVYAGITEKGAILCGISAVLFALSLTLIGPVLGLVLWLGLSLYTAIDVSSSLTR